MVPESMQTDPGNGRTEPPRRADYVLYAGLGAGCLLQALLGGSGSQGDSIAYLNLSDAMQHHVWHALVNASWFPAYPALLTMARALFGFRLKYDMAAARLVTLALGLLLVAGSAWLAEGLRRLMQARGFGSRELVPRRTLYACAATFAYFLLQLDLMGVKPDLLLAVLTVLSMAALIWGAAEDRWAAFAVAGALAAAAFWTKSFAFAFFCMWYFLLAVTHIRRRRVLGQIVVSAAVFAMLAAPYIGLISAARGRFTIGDAGRVNSAWYVNRAERFNPVADRTVYSFGRAAGSFNHPGELLWKQPEIAYYGGGKVYGSMPQWDDFSYWSDGIVPRMIPGMYLQQIKVDVSSLLLIVPMRAQMLLLLAVIAAFGYGLRRKSVTDPVVMGAGLTALGSIAIYMAVHFEARYVVFSLILLGCLFAACAVSRDGAPEAGSMHRAMLLICAMVLVYGLQGTMREWKQSSAEGDNPVKGQYDVAEFMAGRALAAHYAPGTEVACMGHNVCFDDSNWARFGEVTAAAVISLPHREEDGASEPVCEVLEQNPGALDALRRQHIAAVVGRFEQGRGCSAAWLPLGSSQEFFYLPL